MGHEGTGGLVRTMSLIDRAAFLALVTVFLIAAAVGAAFAQEAPADGGTDRLLADGRLVYEANCQACHGADGRGVPGAFPPLLDNPDVQDSDYMRDVIRNGLQGEIEALGETYNGNMPAFALLDDAQVTALIAYLQDGLGAPLPAAAPSVDTGGTAGTSLPSASVLAYGIGFLVALIAVAIVVTPIVVSPADEGGRFTEVQAWLKSAVIVLFVIGATVVVPSLVMESEFMSEPPSVYGDLISTELWDTIRGLTGTAVWLIAFGLAVWGLRRVQRKRLI